MKDGLPCAHAFKILSEESKNTIGYTFKEIIREN